MTFPARPRASGGQDMLERSRGLVLVLLAVWSWHAAPTRAAEKSDPHLPPEYIEVTATRAPEDPLLVPAAISVVTGDDLIARGATDLPTALSLLAGVDVAPGGDAGPAGSVPELWGLREFDAFLLVVDGVPWGGTFNPSLTTVSLDDVERIEVLRGPAPVLYGATSFVGVINIIHRDPGNSRNLASASVASYGSGSIASSMRLPQHGSWQNSVALEAGTEGYRDDRTGYSRGRIAWRSAMDAGPGKMTWDLSALWLGQDPASPHLREGRSLSPRTPLDANYNPGGAHLDERRVALAGRYALPLRLGEWTAALSISNSGQGILRGFLTDPDAVPFNARGYRQDLSITDVWFDTHAVFTFGSGWRVIAGLDNLYGNATADGGGFDYAVPLGGSFAPDGDLIPPDLLGSLRDERNFAGLYGQADWTPVSRLRIELGARLNYTYESRQVRQVDLPGGSPGAVDAGRDTDALWRGSGAAGLVWTAWEDAGSSFGIYGNVRYTFKPAAVDFSLESPAEILDPETATSVELGAKGRWLDGRIGLGVSAFQMDMDNLVVSETINGMPVLVNANSQRFRGIEVEGSWRLPRDVFVRAGYSLHDARFQDYTREFDGIPIQLGGKRLEMSARNMASAGVAYARRGGFFANAEARYIGSRYLNKRNTALAPAYATWRAGIGYRFRRGEIRIDGENLNNQRAPVAESEIGDAQYYLLPARKFRLGGSVFF
jgi:outer membrane receptor protein involved in Fe transport